MYIDSHCHLQLISDISEELSVAEVVATAAANKVTQMLCVATNLQQMPVLLDINNKYPNVDISTGLHPNEVIELEPTVEEYLLYAKRKAVVAIGETGLDYYRSKNEDNFLQQQRFINQLEVAAATKKPIIIHTREAGNDTIDKLTEYKSRVTGVIHCFTETWDFAKKALDLGFYISFSGIVTFKNAHDLREVAKKIPLDRLLVETDSPYLAPVPYRGKTNQPSYVAHVVASLADLLNINVTKLAEISSSNYLKLFRT